MKGYRAKVSVMAAMAGGQKLLARRSIRGAIRCFDEALRLDPLCVQAYLYRAGLKLLASDDEGSLADFSAISRINHAYLPAYRDLTTPSAEEFPELIAAVERVLRLDPDCSWAHVFRAFSFRSLLRYEEAVRDIDRALSCEPRSAALWAMRSRVKLTNSLKTYDGVFDMRTALKLEPRWGWLWCWLGEALRHQGRFQSAERALTRGITLDPRYKRGYAWRGGVRVALRKYRQANRDLDLSLAWDPIYHHDFEYTADQKSWAHNQKMIAYRGLGDLRKALSHLNRAHSFGPRYGWVFNPQNDPEVFEAGIRELSDFLRRSPRSSWAHAWRGWTYMQHHDPERALEDFEHALRLSPASAWPWAWKGKTLLHMGRVDQSIAALHRAVRLDGSYSPALGWRAEACRLKGKFGAAIRDFSRTIELDHRAAWAFAGRGECWQKIGKLTASRADLDRALSICPDYAEAYGWRAEVRRLSGDLGGALDDADRALSLKPGLVMTYLTRSLIKNGLRDFKGQRQDFRRASRLDPELMRPRKLND